MTLVFGGMGRPPGDARPMARTGILHGFGGRQRPPLHVPGGDRRRLMTVGDDMAEEPRPVDQSAPRPAGLSRTQRFAIVGVLCTLPVWWVGGSLVVVAGLKPDPRPTDVAPAAALSGRDLY